VRNVLTTKNIRRTRQREREEHPKEGEEHPKEGEERPLTPSYEEGEWNTPKMGSGTPPYPLL